MSRARRVLVPMLAASMALTTGSVAVQAQSPAAECDYTDATPVTLQLQWVTQAQFAGYFAAKDLCYYAEQGLNVTLQELDPQGAGPQVIGSATDGPEFTIAWVPKVLELRGQTENPSDLVDIAQVFQRSGTLSLAWADSGITSPADFKGKVVGMWPFDNEYEVTAAIKKAGLTDAVYTKADQFFEMDSFVNRTMDSAMAMIYNEYAQVLEKVNPATGELFQPEDLNIINYNDVGTAMLQDAIWARESWLAEEGNEDIATRFLAASFKGWQHCRDNVQECADIVLQNSPILGAGHQLWMANEVNGLIWPAEGGIGAVPTDSWDQTVQIAIDAGIIPAAPSEGTYRTDLADAARALLEGDTTGTDFQKEVVAITPAGE